MPSKNKDRPRNRKQTRQFEGGTSSVALCLTVFVMLSCASVFDGLWSPAGKGLTSWFPFVMSNSEFVTFPLISWVRCGT